MSPRKSLVAAGTAAILAGAVLAACAPAEGHDGADANPAPATTTAEPTGAASTIREVTEPETRLLVAADNAVVVLNAHTLEVLATFELSARPGFQVAGDGRHVYLMNPDEVQVLDVATWSLPHGDHGHHYVDEPSLLDLTITGTGATSHAISDDERSVIWFDGDGSIASIAFDELLDGTPEVTRIETGSPHHGVAAPMADGGYIVSVADGDERLGVALLDAEGNEVERHEECAGIHGEAHVHGGYAFGCDGGILVVDSSGATTIAAPIASAGTSTLHADDHGHLLLGNIRHADADRESTELAVYDVDHGHARAVDLGVGYGSFGVAGDVGFALGVDGVIYLIDLEAAEVVAEHGVLSPWEMPDEWRDPRPVATADARHAWITNPADSSVTVIDLATGELVATTSLAVVPTATAVVNGR